MAIIHFLFLILSRYIYQFVGIIAAQSNYCIVSHSLLFNLWISWSSPAVKFANIISFCAVLWPICPCFYVISLSVIRETVARIKSPAGIFCRTLQYTRAYRYLTYFSTLLIYPISFVRWLYSCARHCWALVHYGQNDFYLKHLKHYDSLSLLELSSPALAHHT